MITAKEARALAGITEIDYDFFLDEACTLIRKAAEKKESYIILKHNAFWVIGARCKTQPWRAIQLKLFNLGFRVSKYSDTGTLIRWN